MHKFLRSIFRNGDKLLLAEPKNRKVYVVIEDYISTHVTVEIDSDVITYGLRLAATLEQLELRAKVYINGQCSTFRIR